MKYSQDLAGSALAPQPRGIFPRLEKLEIEKVEAVDVDEVEVKNDAQEEVKNHALVEVRNGAQQVDRHHVDKAEYRRKEHPRKKGGVLRRTLKSSL